MNGWKDGFQCFNIDFQYLITMLMILNKGKVVFRTFSQTCRLGKVALCFYLYEYILGHMACSVGMYMRSIMTNTLYCSFLFSWNRILPFLWNLHNIWLWSDLVKKYFFIFRFYDWVLRAPFLLFPNQLSPEIQIHIIGYIYFY